MSKAKDIDDHERPVTSKLSIVAVVSLVIVNCSMSVPARESYSPYVGQTHPRQVYWGDTHLHTKISLDAISSGNNQLGPQEAYRFARGEAVTAHNGMVARLRRPLDFLVVADHAENLGLIDSLRVSDPELLSTQTGKRLYEEYQRIVAIEDPAKRSEAIGKFQYGFWPTTGESAIKEANYARSMWMRVVANADKFNSPEKFTAFVGYEWSSPGSDPIGNLHRVVIFEDGAGKADQIVPFSTFDSRDPADLWAFLDAYQRKTGGKVLAIPHNGNLSNGEMFAPVDYRGRTLTASYVRARSLWEPLYEVTQIKGTSEAHPKLSPNDEFAEFEIWNGWLGRDLSRRYTFAGQEFGGRDWDETEIRRKHAEYARPALKRGLQFQSELGANPFKFGMIGSTDSHTSLTTADDDNFWGKITTNEPHMQRITASAWGSPLPGWELASSGYAAVWATANTRQALFAAMKRKEVYATTGPRIEVRFFGGWEFTKDDALKPDLALIGYRKGVPMGGDLTNAPRGKAPSFLIRAVKDPDGANLDRVQVIKGWLDKKGETHELIFNVALSDGREDQEGRAPVVGNTTNLADASYVNTIGDPELAVVWTDPDFDPGEHAFYYVRVIEIPTPRWTAYDAKFFRIKTVPPEISMLTQERAYTSAIWYSPAN